MEGAKHVSDSIDFQRHVEYITNAFCHLIKAISSYNVPFRLP